MADITITGVRAAAATSGKLGSSTAFSSLEVQGLLPKLSVQVDVTNLPTSSTRTWTDITSQVRQLQYVRSGRSDERQRTETGTLTALCNDRGNAITGLGIRKTQWVRVQASWAGVTYSRWQGLFESLPRQWPASGKDAVVELHAADVLKVFNLYDLAGGTFSAQRNDQRVAQIAALAGVGTLSIDTGTDAADAAGTALAEGSMALSALLEIEASENGLLIAEPTGQVSFQGRHWRMLNAATATLTFGEVAGQVPYRDSVVREDDDSRIANIVSVTAAGATSGIVVEDISSQGTHFKRRLNRSLLSSDVSIATDAAYYLLNRYKDPSPRVPSLVVELASVGTTLKPTVLALANSSRANWSRAAVTPISDAVYVEKITETITPGVGWQIEYGLSPAVDEAGWVLDSASLSVLDTSTRLVY